MIMRMATGFAAGLLVIGISGALYQEWCVQSERSLFPAPGHLVSIGTRRLHLICQGEGSPTVIFEAGGFASVMSSTAGREILSAHTRVCSYDRMGMGWSDPGPPVISVGLLAEDLRRLTESAGLQPPFILVPSSFGGLPTEMFARLYPDRVTGLVYVDAANSAILEKLGDEIGSMPLRAACILPMAARLGIVRAADPFGLRKQSASWAPQSIALLYRVQTMNTLCGLARGAAASIQELTTAPPLREGVPLIVLAHERPDELLPPGFSGPARRLEAAWLPSQQRFAQRSRRGSVRVVPGSDHMIGSKQPEVVAAAVMEIIKQVRGRQ